MVVIGAMTDISHSLQYYLCHECLTMRADQAKMAPVRAPIDALTNPTTNAMTISNGQRLCDVGSFKPSITTRTNTTAGMEAVSIRIIVRNFATR